jgi:hypothetical protein
MDKRTLLAFALMMLVYLGWMAWFAPKPRPGAEDAKEAALPAESGAGDAFREMQHSQTEGQTGADENLPSRHDRRAG